MFGRFFKRRSSAPAAQVPQKFPLDYLLDANWSGGFFSTIGQSAVGIADRDGIFLAVGTLARYVASSPAGDEIDVIFMGRGIKYSGANPFKAEYTPTGRFSKGSTVYLSRGLFLQRIGETEQRMKEEGARAWDGFNQFKATVESNRGPRFFYE